MKERKSRIALVAPDNPGTFRSRRIQKENLALGYLSAQLKTLGHKVEIYDARLFNLTPEAVCEEIIHFNPGIIGISLIVEEAAEWSTKLTLLLKQGAFQPHIVLGGYFPSLQPERALELISGTDLVVVGEGELTLSEIVCRLGKQQDLVGIPGTVSRLPAGKFFYGAHRPLVENLDNLSFPYHYALSHIPEISIEGSRGCFNNCTFCAVSPHFKASPRLSWRGRSPENIVEEILKLRKRVPQINYYRFVDPDFIGAKGFGEQRLFRLAELFKEYLPGIKFFIETRPTNVRNKRLFKALKEAGLAEVYIGIESGSEKILTCMRKGFSLEQTRNAISLLSELNIDYQYGFMMFTPWSEEEDIRASVAFLSEIGSVQIDKLFYDMYVIPGTPAVKQIEELGMQPLEEMVGTGYLKDAPRLVRQLRLIGKKLETDYSSFLTELWFLFQTLRPYLREGENWARVLEKKVSNLYLDIFIYCLEEVKKTDSEDSKIAEIVLSSCVSRFKSKIKELTRDLLAKVNRS